MSLHTSFPLLLCLLFPILSILWDVKSGISVWQVAEPQAIVNSAAFSPDGKSIAVALSPVNGGSSFSYVVVSFVDVTTGQELRRFNYPYSGVSKIAFSPDGRYLLVSTQTQADLWDVNNIAAPVHTFFGALGTLLAVFSPDGRIVVTVDFKGLQLWDVATGKAVGHFDHSLPGNNVVFSPDGKYVLTSTIKDHLVQLWDAQSGGKLVTYAGHSDAVNSIAFSPDGSTILTGSSDNTVRLWDTKSGAELRRLQANQTTVWSIAFSPDGQSIAAGLRSGLVRLWNLQTGWRRISYTSPLRSISVSSDGKYFGTGSADGSVQLWQAGSGMMQYQVQTNPYPIYQVAFSRDGRFFGEVQYLFTVLWEVGTGNLVRKYGGTQGDTFGLTFSPDGKQFAAATDNKDIQLFDIQTGVLVGNLIGHTDTVITASFSPDGKYLVSASYDKTARVWDVQTKQEVHRFDHSGALYTAVFTADGKAILTGGSDNVLHLWDIATGKEMRQFIGHTGAVNWVKFSPDGQNILSVSSHDSTARIWDFTTGQEIRRFIHVGIADATFSPDGKYVYSAGTDKIIRKWNLDYPDLIASVCARLPRDFTDAERTDYHIDDKEPTCPQFSVQGATNWSTSTPVQTISIGTPLAP